MATTVKLTRMAQW